MVWDSRNSSHARCVRHLIERQKRMTNIRIAIPESPKVGDVIEIKPLIRHEMESGYRRGSRGEVIPRNIITRFECHFEDELVFASDFFPAVSANPILTFYFRVQRSGEFAFKWTDQNGEIWQDRRQISVA